MSDQPHSGPGVGIIFASGMLGAGFSAESVKRGIAMGATAIAVDGGSTDGSLDTLHSLHDPRLRLITEPDRGQSHAINKGFSLVTGDVVAWLTARPKRMRFLIFHTAGRVFRHARRMVLRVATTAARLADWLEAVRLLPIQV